MISGYTTIKHLTRAKTGSFVQMEGKEPDGLNKLNENETLADFFNRESSRVREKIKNGNITLQPIFKSETIRTMGGTVMPGTVYHHTLPKGTDRIIIYPTGSVSVSTFRKRQPQEIHFRAEGSAATVKITCIGNFTGSEV